MTKKENKTTKKNMYFEAVGKEMKDSTELRRKIQGEI